MRVKIKKVFKPTYWYKDCDGLTFEVDGPAHYSLKNDEQGRLIDADDCDIVEEEETK